MRSSALVVLLLLSSTAFAQAKSATETPETAPHRTYLQNYKDMMLAGCIAQAYAYTPDVKRDADAASSAYNEWGNFDAENDVEERAALLGRFLSQPYGSFEPDVKLDLMKCIDMYHSRALDALARKYVKTPNRSFAKDNPDWRD